MADFASDKGFNEAKFNERERAKERYNKCVEEARKPEFYKDKETQCNATLAAGQEANQNDRVAKEAEAQKRFEEALKTAENAFVQKSGILDAIEKKCNEPGGKTNVNIGSLTTTGTGTATQPNSSACTGVFGGNNPDLQKQINDLENQLQKAKAGGAKKGLYGIDNIQASLDRLRQELRDSARTCKTDADCGSSEAVCCSGKQVGRAFCDAGVCASKKTDWVDPEICAGKPAKCVVPSTGVTQQDGVYISRTIPEVGSCSQNLQVLTLKQASPDSVRYSDRKCVVPSTGVTQQDGVYISRTIPEVGSCSQNLQVLTLKQASPDSVRYSLNGNITYWLRIDKPGGALPASVNVTYSCNTVQGFGPGTYTANGSITVYNAANELINTIPFNVSITVTAVENLIEVIEYNGKYLPVSQLIIEDEVGCGAEHWHAAQGVVTATDGTKVSDPGPQCGYGKVQDKPVKKVSAPKVSSPGAGIEVRGLEFLKNQ